jgi:hypothetical protein
MPYSNEACRNHWRRMTELDPGETMIKGPFRKKRQREQMRNAFERYKKCQAIPVLPVICQTVEPDSSSMLTDILAPSFDSSSLRGTNSVPAALSDQNAELPDVLSPPFLTSEGTTPADSVHSILTPVAQDVMPQGFMPGAVKEKDVSMVRSDRAGAYQSLPGTRIKRPVPLEFDEDVNSISGRISNGPLIPSAREELAWTQRIPNPVPVHKPGNWNRSMSTTSLAAVQEEPEPADGKLPKHEKTISELEDEMKDSRGFINFVKNILTNPRQSVHSMISASGTIRSRFSSPRTSQHSNRDSVPPENTNSFHHPPFISNRDTHISASQLPQGMIYEIEQQSSSLFQELRRPGASDNDATTRILQILQGSDPARASNVVNARNSSGETPLEVALALGNVPACEVLLEAGADVYARTSTGKTLAEFAHKAEREAKNNTYFAAIGICKNRILEHPLSQKDSKSRKAKNDKKNSKPHASSQMASETRLPRRAQGSSHSMSNGGPPFTPATNMIQDEATSLGFGHTTYQPPLHNAIGGMHSFELKSAPFSMTTTTPYHSVPVSVSPGQATGPDVSGLRPFWSPPPRIDSAGWQNQGLQSLTTDPSQMLPPNTKSWTERSMGIPSSAQLGGGFATSDMSSTAGNSFSSSGIGVPEYKPGTHSGLHDRLPNGGRFYVSPSSRSSLPIGQQFSHRDARIIDTGNSVHLHYPMVTQFHSSVPNTQTPLAREPDFGPNNDIYTNMANEVAYSNVSFQQQPQFSDTNFAAETYHSPLNPSPTSNSTSTTYAFSSNQHMPQASAPFTNPTFATSQPYNLTPLPTQSSSLSAMDSEPLSSTTSNLYYDPNWNPYPSSI